VPPIIHPSAFSLIYSWETGYKYSKYCPFIMNKV
jgi:hypothetical protein